MQSSLEFYLSPEVSKLRNSLAVPSEKLNGYEPVSILEMYQVHVQRLFDYGMQVCSNRELVTESLMAVFVHVRNQSDLPGATKSIRLSLFKRFRKHVTKQMLSLKKLQVCDENADSCDKYAGQLTPMQREAVFLKLKCEFSYQEVAAIMDIRIKSVHNLVSQAFENISHQRKES